MKGVVFVEFLDMVETRFSIETTERLLEMSALPSKGVYTSVGTYSQSESGHGATFIIELPITQVIAPEADAPSPMGKVKPAATKKGRILVVDDEAGVRGLIEKVLTQTGHSVDTSGNAEEAMDKLNSATYDVLFVDVRMPGMSGMELYAGILENAPAMANRTIFITGDAMGSDVKAFLTQNNLPYLAKPFGIEALEEKVNTVLKAGSQEMTVQAV